MDSNTKTYGPQPTIPFTFFSEKTPKGFDSAESPMDLIRKIERTFPTPDSRQTEIFPNPARVFYRGQAEANHGLTSSLYRLCRDTLGRLPREKDMQLAETAIIDAMRHEGIGRLMTDLELLEVLQHHAIPTRLIDVSTHPLEALFFAVDSDDSRPGRFFAIRLDDATPSWWQTKIDSREVELPWAGMDRGTDQAASEWTQLMEVLDADSLDPRMRAQRGKFLIGGLNRAYSGRAMNSYNSSEFAEISNLGINFKQPIVKKRNESWPATGWSIAIPPEWKPFIRNHLASLDNPITRDTMYPPISEVSRLSRVVARNAIVRNVSV